MQTIDNEKWQLIRNDNGEWISEEYAEYLSKTEATLLKARYGEKISIQHGPEGCFWCYKHQLDALRKKAETNKPELRSIKINKSKKG